MLSTNLRMVSSRMRTFSFSEVRRLATRSQTEGASTSASGDSSLGGHVYGLLGVHVAHLVVRAPTDLGHPGASEGGLGQSFNVARCRVPTELPAGPAAQYECIPLAFGSMGGYQAGERSIAFLGGAGALYTDKAKRIIPHGCVMHRWSRSD